jgi:hypothetical protein
MRASSNEPANIELTAPTTFVQVRMATLAWAPFNTRSDEPGAAAVPSAPT